VPCSAVEKVAKQKHRLQTSQPVVDSITRSHLRCALPAADAVISFPQQRLLGYIWMPRTDGQRVVCIAGEVSSLHCNKQCSTTSRDEVVLLQLQNASATSRLVAAISQTEGLMLHRYYCFSDAKCGDRLIGLGALTERLCRFYRVTTTKQRRKNSRSPSAWYRLQWRASGTHVYVGLHRTLQLDSFQQLEHVVYHPVCILCTRVRLPVLTASTQCTPVSCFPATISIYVTAVHRSRNSVQ